MNKKNFCPLIAAVLLLSPAALALAAAPGVDDIVARANLAAYYAGDDGRSQVTMTITDGQGRARSRELTILRRDVADGGEQKFYVYFKKPADVRKTVFLVHKKLQGDDDRWLYLPAMDLVKRIAASDKRTSFVGSHFVYEDVSGRSLQEDKHELIATTDRHYVIKNTPKSADLVEFSSYTIWIDRKNFLPVKAEYLDKQGKKSRLVEALELKDIQGFPTVTKSRAQDLAGGGETVVEFAEVQYNVGLDDALFTERSLRQPPRELRR